MTITNNQNARGKQADELTQEKDRKWREVLMVSFTSRHSPDAVLFFIRLGIERTTEVTLRCVALPNLRRSCLITWGMAGKLWPSTGSRVC